MKWDLVWLTDAQFAKIGQHLATDTRGKPRVDDRHVISGIVQVLKSGGRWIDAPPDFGPKKDALQPLCLLGVEERFRSRWWRHCRAADAGPDDS
jgi:transposase